MKSLFHSRVQQNYAKLTRSQAALSQYILENSQEVPFLSSAELASRVNVSDATVTRFCLALGYAGYADFQKDMQRWVQSKLAPSERFEKTSRQKPKNFFLQTFDRDLQNLKETIDNCSPADLKRAIQLLGHSERIFIIGLRSSFALAFLLHHQLSKILPNTILLDTAQGMLFDPVVGIGPRDSLFGISFPRYAKGTLQMAEYSRNRGSKIVAVTDSILSPLAQISDVVLPVKIDSQAFFGSYTAAVAVLNCLIAGISIINPRRSARALKEIEARLPQEDTWVVRRP